MTTRSRFALALERLQSTDWNRFESFASAFLVADFPDLRTVANPSGDDGRDGELFSPHDEPSVVLQYSVTEQWQTKIRATAKRLNKTIPTARQLIYVTNQLIGAKADGAKKALRKDFGLNLDLRDRTYFLDRYEGDAHLEGVAENLAVDIVDPYLQSKEIIERKAQALSPGESRAALVFLAMQWEDDTRDKGLTKTVFDALVRTALRSTNSSNRLSREHVHVAVIGLLPQRDQQLVIRETDKALGRLTKQYVRHYAKPDDEFCLTHEESLRIRERLAENEVQDQELSHEITAVINQVFSADERKRYEESIKLDEVCRRCIEQFLLQRGELFVAALDGGQLDAIGFESVRALVTEVLGRQVTKPDSRLAQKVSSVVQGVLTAPGTAASNYVRDVADAYTLLAFMRETPDIQAAATKMFSIGEIWVDTSIVLPILAEDLASQERQQFRHLLQVAREAGLKLKVSPGVIEEIVAHTNKCRACSTCDSNEWQGQVPYLFSYYIATGRAVGGFWNWLQRFRGDARPQDDISDYLLRFHGIATENIAIDAAKADDDLRRAVKESWTDVHMARRGDQFDPMLALRLAEHDTENYAGVIVRRKQQGESAFGFTSWWLTLDHSAFGITGRLRSRLIGALPLSPVMSADFLTNYLSFGPLRLRANKAHNSSLPVWMDSQTLEMTPELLEVARKVRESAKGKDEYVIQRMVRDELDRAKRRAGAVTERGLAGTLQ